MPFNFDLERMKCAVEGETIQLPSGLERYERRFWIIWAGKLFAHRKDLSGEELTQYAKEMYLKHSKEI